MKKYYKYITLGIIMILIIIVCILFFGNCSHNYLYGGRLKNNDNDIQVILFISRNNNGDLLNYYTDILYTDDEIISGRVFYYKDNKRQVVLGNGLNKYNFSRKNENKKEYGEDYIDTILKKDLYFDLCRDSLCNDVYSTIKLDFSELK